MKKIEAILPVSNAQCVIEQLCNLEIDGLITTNVTVIDKKRTHKRMYRGFAYDDDSSSGVKVEVNVSDRDVVRAESLLAENIAQ